MSNDFMTIPRAASVDMAHEDVALPLRNAIGMIRIFEQIIPGLSCSHQLISGVFGDVQTQRGHGFRVLCILLYAV